MKKIAIAVVALPLTCLGAGYAAGLAFIATPDAAMSAETESGSSTEHAAAPTQDSAPDAETETEIADSHAKPEPVDPDPYALAEDRTIIRLGQMTIPVEKQSSVSYVVADFALKLENLEIAERYKRVEEATRLRDSLLTAMNKVAESRVLRGVSIDSDALSSMLVGMLSQDYEGITEVMFVSLYKQDVARL